MKQQRTYSDERRRQIRRSLNRATANMPYQYRQIARSIEDALFHRKPISIRDGAERLRISMSEYYELAGQLWAAVLKDVPELIDHDLGV